MKNAISLLLLIATGAFAAERPLRDALTFHASFDSGIDADFARGDKRLYSAPSMQKKSEAKTGLPESGEVVVAKGEGRFGDGLRFLKKKSPLVFFETEKNFHYSRTNWSGAVSFWLSLDPETELEPGYTDPIQITPRAWDDAAFFVEFGKDEKPRHFRLGVYADHKVWNPNNRDWNAIPFAEKPLVSVERPPFAKGKWTHIVFTFENFNTGRPNGVATLYLDGKRQGALSPRVQTFTWDPSKTLIMLGLSYIGLWDELSIFDRALSAEEVKSLHELPGGVTALL
ncbi:MAG: LamG domain-containing protein [Verrucomicrobia subdivision 3 bacterium]|nr:LamG domain-containing protein [Limisphaerales bacterium]